MMNAIEFLKGTDRHRIVSTGDLNEYQIAESRRENKMFVDSDTGLGWVLLPWELTTDKDRERERKFFEKPEYQKRVLQEKIELDERLEKLGAFRLISMFESLPVDEQHRLHRQYAAMEEYSRILKERIAEFR